MEPIRVERTIELKSSPADLWPQVSNTDRINRALGLPSTESSAPDPKDMRKTVRSRLMGLPVTWLEAPFEYVDARYYLLARDFVNGPILRYEWGLKLAADGAGSTAVLHGAFWPRPRRSPTSPASSPGSTSRSPASGASRPRGAP